MDKHASVLHYASSRLDSRFRSSRALERALTWSSDPLAGGINKRTHRSSFANVPGFIAVIEGHAEHSYHLGLPYSCAAKAADVLGERCCAR